MKNIIGFIFVMLCFTNLSIAQDKMLVEFTFRVEGECGMCQDRIETTALKAGAETAEYDLGSKILTVNIDFNTMDINDIRWAIAEAGHDNGDFITSDDVYDDLPDCCKYRPGDGFGHSEDPNAVMEVLSGYIFAQEGKKRIPMIGAHVMLENTGEGTTTNKQGYFKIDNSNALSRNIVISYIGYPEKTVEIDELGEVEITLSEAMELDVVEIVYRKPTTEVSFINALNTETLTRKELCKAACCNLAESFETNPSVDISYPDAVTGTRTIQMLGLAGPYVKIDRELIPDIRVRIYI